MYSECVVGECAGCTVSIVCVACGVRMVCGVEYVGRVVFAGCAALCCVCCVLRCFVARQSERVMNAPVASACSDTEVVGGSWRV